MLNNWLMYLRKSRADSPTETVEEVLAKHETILQEYCECKLGYRIPEDCIYREVISGESIEERTEIKKVLSRIEDINIKGVIVVEPQRLSRGDLEDCGRLINILRYSNTLVLTPTMSYNLENKMERQFFQEELMRGRYYLEYTKEILLRGRVASAKRGCYTGSIAPFGYDKVKIGKDWTLKPNQYADVVRFMFDWYGNQNKTPNEIATELNRLEIPSVSKNKKWRKEVVSKMLNNQHYIGKIFFQKRKNVTHFVDGKKVESRYKQKDYICVEGKHEAIVDEALFNKVQERFSKNPPVKADKQLRNVFASLIYCNKCGSAMRYKPMNRGKAYFCCNTKGCSRSVQDVVLIETVIKALELAELPKLKVRFNNGEGDAVELQKKRLKELEAEMEALREQEETQYELLETKKYSQALFDKRNKVLREKMEKCEFLIAEARRTMPSKIDFEDKIATLENAIQSLRSPEVAVKDKNKLLKTVVERINYTSLNDGEKKPVKFHLDIKMRI